MARHELNDLAGLVTLAAALGFENSKEFHVYVERWMARATDPFPQPRYVERQGESRKIRLWPCAQVAAWSARHPDLVPGGFNWEPVHTAHER